MLSGENEEQRDSTGQGVPWDEGGRESRGLGRRVTMELYDNVVDRKIILVNRDRQLSWRGWRSHTSSHTSSHTFPHHLVPANARSVLWGWKGSMT